MSQEMSQGVRAEAAGTVVINGRPLPRMGYGTMGLGRAAQTGRVTREAGVQLLQHALDLGVRVYDTAQFYGDGAANELLGSAFASQRDEVCYISKVGTRTTTDGPRPVTAAQRPEELRATVEQNLRSLATDHIDVVYMRRMDMGPGLVVDSPAQQVPLDDQLAELVRLRDAGTIRGIGLSHVTLDQVRQALPVGIVSVSNIYNVLDRGDEDLLRWAEQHDVVWSPYFPLGGARQHGAVGEDAVVRRVAQEVAATPSQVGLAWLLAHTPQSLVIAGTTSIEHLDENVAAASVRLPEDALQRLDALA